MRLRTVALFLALTLLAAPCAAQAQPAAQDPRIGVLVPGSPSALEVQRAAEVFAQGLRELGYVEGENIAIESRYAQGRLSVLPELAAELVGLQVDVIVAGGDAATLAAKRTTRTIPLVMAGSSDPVDLGIVASFARPGGNITGLTLLSPDLSAKRLDLFQELLPTPSRVAVLWNAGNPINVLAWAAMQVAMAARSELTLQSQPVRGVYDVRNAMAAMAAQRPDGLIVLADPLIRRDIERLLDFAVANRLPAMYEARADVEAGGLLGYGVNQWDLGVAPVSWTVKDFRPCHVR